MKQVTATGQSIDEAIETALSELNTTKERVEISVIDEGKKGILGIFGSRPAVVKVQVKIDPIEEAKKYLLDICDKLQIQIEIETEVDGKYVFFNITSDKTGLLIGKRGQTLNALQTLTQLVLNKYADEFMIVRLDTENYRERRKESLILLANRLANKVVRERKQVTLEPMPAYERKIIHAALSEHSQVETYSEGREPKRYLVISLK